MRISFFQTILFPVLFFIITWGSFHLSFIEDVGKNSSSTSFESTLVKESEKQNSTKEIHGIEKTLAITPAINHQNLTSTAFQSITEGKETKHALVTISPTLRHCPPPGNWNVIFIQPGDTIINISRNYDISPAQLLKANCIKDSDIAPGRILYVPPLPTMPPQTLTPSPCTPPLGWVLYTIKPGDTLSSLSRNTNITLESLLRANCLKENVPLSIGQRIYLPYTPPTPMITRIIPWWTITPTWNPSVIPLPTSTSTYESFPTTFPSPIATEESSPVITDTPFPTLPSPPLIQQNNLSSKTPKP